MDIQRYEPFPEGTAPDGWPQTYVDEAVLVRAEVLLRRWMELHPRHVGYLPQETSTFLAVSARRGHNE